MVYRTFCVVQNRRKVIFFFSDSRCQCLCPACGAEGEKCLKSDECFSADVETLSDQEHRLICICNPSYG